MTHSVPSTSLNYEPILSSGKTTERIVAIDVLRGLDIFFLIFVGPFLLVACRKFDLPLESWIRDQLSHRAWTGFTCWDLIMPLFMFLAGASIPFAVANHRAHGYGQGRLIVRLLKRVLVLWILGGIVQGNFLALNPNRIFLYSNTLQSIAMGCMIAYPVVMFMKLRGQVITLVVLLLTYWAFFLFSGDVYATQINIAEKIDIAFLGRFRDQARILADGTVNFSPGYHYAWILPSISFGAITLMGSIAGTLLKNETATQKQKFLALLYVGAGALLLGWSWHWIHPVIKPIFTSSMVLVAGGYSMLLLATCYAITDILNFCRGIGFLKVIGFNALLAYCISEMALLNTVPPQLFFGLKQYVGDGFYELILKLAIFALLYFILHLLYKQKISIRA